VEFLVYWEKCRDLAVQGGNTSFSMNGCSITDQKTFFPFAHSPAMLPFPENEYQKDGCITSPSPSSRHPNECAANTSHGIDILQIAPDPIRLLLQRRYCYYLPVLPRRRNRSTSAYSSSLP
jgi:hypothetical protein